MYIIAIVVTAMILFCLAYLRFVIVKKEAEEWNYRVYRYGKYCILYNQHCDDIEANRINDAQVVFIFLMFWKASPRYFFDNCPDFVDIDHLIQNKII